MTARALPTPHADNCGCVLCLALRTARAAPADTGVVLLSVEQRRYLYTFVKRWNRDRVARGLPEMLANDALTEGLRALVEMIS
jgi:hypothetical protein